MVAFVHLASRYKTWPSGLFGPLSCDKSSRHALLEMSSHTGSPSGSQAGDNVLTVPVSGATQEVKAEGTKAKPSTKQLRSTVLNAILRVYRVSDAKARLIMRQFDFESTTIQQSDCELLGKDTSLPDQHDIACMLLQHLRPAAPRNPNLVYDPTCKQWFKLDLNRGIYVSFMRLDEALQLLRVIFDVYHTIGLECGWLSPDNDKSEPRQYNLFAEYRRQNAMKYLKYLYESEWLHDPDFESTLDTAKWAIMFKNAELSLLDCGEFEPSYLEPVLSDTRLSMPKYRWTKSNGIMLDPCLLELDDTDEDTYGRFNQYFQSSFAPAGSGPEAAKLALGILVAGRVLERGLVTLMQGEHNTGKSTYIMFLRCFLGPYVVKHTSQNALLTKDRDLTVSAAKLFQYARLIEIPELKGDIKISGNIFKLLTENEIASGSVKYDRRYAGLVAHYNANVCIVEGETDGGRAVAGRTEFIKFTRENAVLTHLRTELESDNTTRQLAAHFVALQMQFAHEKLMGHVPNEAGDDVLRASMPPEWRLSAKLATSKPNYVTECVEKEFEYTGYATDRVHGGVIRGLVGKYFRETVQMNLPVNDSLYIMDELRRGGWSGLHSKNGVYVGVKKLGTASKSYRARETGQSVNLADDDDEVAPRRTIPSRRAKSLSRAGSTGSPGSQGNQSRTPVKDTQASASKAPAPPAPRFDQPGPARVLTYSQLQPSQPDQPTQQPGQSQPTQQPTQQPGQSQPTQPSLEMMFSQPPQASIGQGLTSLGGLLGTDEQVPRQLQPGSVVDTFAATINPAPHDSQAVQQQLDFIGVHGRELGLKSRRASLNPAFDVLCESEDQGAAKRARFGDEEEGDYCHKCQYDGDGILMLACPDCVASGSKSPSMLHD